MEDIMNNLLLPNSTWKQSELEHVHGSYYGKPFTGKVIADRLHTCNYAVMFTVKLDQPIQVFGEWRERVTVGGYPGRESLESLYTDSN
jgi:tRNA splicing ligase